MNINTVEYFVREVIHSLRRNNWMSVASIGTVAVSLFIFGMFLMLVMNMNKMVDAMESQVQIKVYLEDDFSRDDARELEVDLKKMQGVEKVTFVPKEEAMEKFKERLGDQKTLLDALDETNPLPDSFEVMVVQPEMVKTAAENIEKFEGVDSAKYGQDVMEHLFDITRLIRIFGFALMMVLALATLFIISNTIRLTVFARRKEIAIMKYVGATDWFIRWPFVLEGIVMGFLGSLIASVVLRFTYSGITAKIYDTLAFFPLIPEEPFLNYVTMIVVIGGMIMGAIGSTVSIKRFLKV
ncbi:permease-like cell division protein FtsX [Anaerovibrio lipolyticus]|uniref:permease-like cell division protein FtsX n=1 Tax=Anaerovibrio lipolyticus TaxID=82374 RepID=UPI0026F14B1C|nr:permease-like cell division protein FtsX [Anaerovibrio lipolyticus]MBE6105791.1 ABC transporter permease [Anaerovibrio lipolyticus]